MFTMDSWVCWSRGNKPLAIKCVLYLRDRWTDGHMTWVHVLECILTINFLGNKLVGEFVTEDLNNLDADLKEEEEINK